MASLYKRSGSPYWWIRYRDPQSREIRRESTRYRIGSTHEHAAARKRCAEYTLREQSLRGTRTGGWQWVPGYIEERSLSPASRVRRLTAWNHLERFLRERRIHHPGQLRRDDCRTYVSFRTDPNPPGRPAKRSTALLELRILSGILGEAIRRGLLDANPCRDLELRRDAGPSRPEMNDTEITTIRAAIRAAGEAARQSGDAAGAERAHFLRVSFEIAMHQGCRLAETHLDIWRDVDLEKREISFRAKGNRSFTTRLNPDLVPLIEELRASGRKTTYDYGAAQPTLRSLAWHRFLKTLGLGHLSFHSTRVTVISRLGRGGAAESAVMRLVGSASTTVRGVYRRLGQQEPADGWEALKTVPADADEASPGKPSGQTRTVRRAKDRSKSASGKSG